MSTQDIPVEDQEKPSSEEHKIQAEGAPAPQPTAPNPTENARLATPPPYVPPAQPAQPPYTWPRYYPGTGPQWAGGGQYGPPYPPPYQRKRSPWPWIIATLVLLFVLLIGGVYSLFSFIGFNFAGYANSVTESRHYSVSANPTFVLNNDTGSIHVRTAPINNEVNIVTTRHTNAGGNVNDVTVSYTQDTAGNTVTVNVVRVTNYNLLSSPTVDFDVTVPSTATLRIETKTGGIDVTGVSGQMILTSNTGSIVARDGTARGSTQLITNTGSITFNGSIDRSGNYRFETNTGSVNVNLPGDSAFHMTATTDTGSINTTFPGVIIQHRSLVGADASGDVGSSPQATISMKTNTGSINLYQR